MHTAKPLVPGPNSFEDEIALEDLTRYESRGTDQILAELVQVGGNTSCSEIHKLINSICNKEFHRSGKNLLLHQ
jgi:hypothetical protein